MFTKQLSSDHICLRSDSQEDAICDTLLHLHLLMMVNRFTAANTGKLFEFEFVLLIVNNCISLVNKFECFVELYKKIVQ